MHLSTMKLLDHRSDVRERCDHRLAWRVIGDRQKRSGDVLERSGKGVAFAWRGWRVPLVGSFITIARPDQDETEPGRKAVIRRVTHAHHDLYVIAAEIIEETTSAKVNTRPDIDLLYRHPDPAVDA